MILAIEVIIASILFRSSLESALAVKSFEAVRIPSGVTEVCSVYCPHWEWAVLHPLLYVLPPLGVHGTAPLNPAAYVPNLVSACSVEECAFYTRKLDH